MLKEIITSKAGFPFYTDYWKSYFCKMTGEQVKECLRIIFHFNETFEILESGDLAIEMVTTTIIGNIKRDAEKRTKQITANKNNGSKGGRPKSKKTPKKPQANPKLTPNNNVNLNHNLNEESKSELTIPNFIDASLWNSFLEMRKLKKAEPTQKAIELIIKELTKFHNQGLDANQSLENSIKSNWTGVFEPKNNNQTQFLTPDQRRRQNNINASEEFLRLTSGDDNVK